MAPSTPSSATHAGSSSSAPSLSLIASSRPSYRPTAVEPPLLQLDALHHLVYHFLLELPLHLQGFLDDALARVKPLQHETYLMRVRLEVRLMLRLRSRLRLRLRPRLGERLGQRTEAYRGGTHLLEG